MRQYSELRKLSSLLLRHGFHYTSMGHEHGRYFIRAYATHINNYSRSTSSIEGEGFTEEAASRSLLKMLTHLESVLQNSASAITAPKKTRKR